MNDVGALTKLRETIARIDEERERQSRQQKQFHICELREALEIASSALVDRIRGKVSERVSPSSR